MPRLRPLRGSPLPGRTVNSDSHFEAIFGASIASRTARCCCLSTMYIVDAGHFLDDKCAIGPRSGPAKGMQEFMGTVNSYATDFDDLGVLALNCFKCKKSRVDATLTSDDAVYWSCSRCRIERRISNRQGTRWDLSEGGEPHG